MRRRLAQQRMTLSDLEWLFHASPHHRNSATITRETKFLGQYFQKLEHEQDRQIHGRTDTWTHGQARPNVLPQPHLWVVNIIGEIVLKSHDLLYNVEYHRRTPYTALNVSRVVSSEICGGKYPEISGNLF